MLGNYLIAAFTVILVLLFGGNLIYEKLVCDFIKGRTTWKNYVLTLVSLPIFVFLGLFFLKSVQAISIYEPPKPISLIFWGIDISEFDNYNKLNDLINVTNSRVVLFGDALDDPLPIKNIIGSIPETHVDSYRSIRIWYDFNRDDERMWHGIVVFGEDRVGHEEWFKHPSDASIAYAKAALEKGEKGIFKNKIYKGMLCNLPTTNLTKSSGRRPLTKPSNEWSGL